MNILRLSSIYLTLAIAVFALGYSNPAFAAKPDCNADPSHKSCKDDSNTSGGDGDGTIPVKVTFRDAQFDRVKSDDGRAYIDGEDKVSTAIGHEGSFYLKRSKGNQEAKRKLILDFSDCASDCTAPPCYDECTALRGKVGGGINLNTMGLEATNDIALFINMHLGTENDGFFTLYFDTARSNCDGYDARVTRTSAGTWEIEGHTACLERLDGNVLRGVYNMPDAMTVEAL